ncbi:DUF349 domain-containing protein [Trueperella bialowiezensis]|uniref:Domain of Uncharacterized Function (DUF349) n=1 Tax=Trueperella bialowiezensis TaxID=312285 RepID=A0A3S4UXS1_9ACTO|nr:DUF349 domain-containing protein [Trueperella bialowiezensis]VEI12473.1 Domain of Uncharacterised Function (DUF349) [Trueperella bialowiezensis]
MTESTNQPQNADATEQAQPTPQPAVPPTPKQAAPRVAAPLPDIDDAAAAEAAKWGRVDDDGNVWLRASGNESERIVGQYAVDGDEKDALGLYVRRYLDLENQVSLLEARVSYISPHEITTSLKTLNEQLVEPAVVGDVDALRRRVEALEGTAEKRREEVKAEREEAKRLALEERTAIVEAAEAIAAQDPQHTHWKNSRQELIDLLDQWKYAQRHSTRIDRPVEDALWKRFSSARTTFDRHRRQFFARRDAERKKIVEVKEQLIARAEEIKDSTDWGATSGQFRELMNEWKRSGRTTRKEDDALWARFSAAQNHFYEARNAFNSKVDEEFAANRDLKLALLEEAEKLVPVTDLEYAKTQIRSIGERWDAIGRVPRADVQRTEGRLREIEDEIRNVESEQWRQSDPDKEERSAGMAAQLQKLIDELDGQIAEARAAGDEKKVKEFEEALEARKAWLAAVQAD